MIQSDAAKAVACLPQPAAQSAAQLQRNHTSTSTATLTSTKAENLPIDKLIQPSEAANSSTPLHTQTMSDAAFKQQTQIQRESQAAPGHQAAATGHASRAEAASVTAARQTASLPPSIPADPSQIPHFSSLELLGRQLCGPTQLGLSSQHGNIADVQAALAQLTAPASAANAATTEKAPYLAQLGAAAAAHASALTAAQVSHQANASSIAPPAQQPIERRQQRASRQARTAYCYAPRIQGRKRKTWGYSCPNGKWLVMLWHEGKHERAGPFDKEEDAAESAWKLYLQMHQLPYTEPPPLTPIPPTAAINSCSSYGTPASSNASPHSLSAALASLEALKPITDPAAAAAADNLPAATPQHVAMLAHHHRGDCTSQPFDSQAAFWRSVATISDSVRAKRPLEQSHAEEPAAKLSKPAQLVLPSNCKPVSASLPLPAKPSHLATSTLPARALKSNAFQKQAFPLAAGSAPSKAPQHGMQRAVVQGGHARASGSGSSSSSSSSMSDSPQAAAGAGGSSNTAAVSAELLHADCQPVHLQEQLSTADAELAEHVSCAALYLQLLQVKLTAVQAKRDAQQDSKVVLSPRSLEQRLRMRTKDVSKCSTLSAGLEALYRALD